MYTELHGLHWYHCFQDCFLESLLKEISEITRDESSSNIQRIQKHDTGCADQPKHSCVCEDVAHHERQHRHRITCKRHGHSDICAMFTYLLLDTFGLKRSRIMRPTMTVIINTQNRLIIMTIRYPRGACACFGHMGAIMAKMDVQYTAALEIFLSQSSNGLTMTTKSNGAARHSN